MKIQINDYVSATLNNGTHIDGTIYSVDSEGFMIDDNISGDIFYVAYAEIKKTNEHIH